MFVVAKTARSKKVAVVLGAMVVFGSVIASADAANAMEGEGNSYSCTISSDFSSYTCAEDGPDFGPVSVGHPALECPKWLTPAQRRECIMDLG
jgi:hypothetical protein